MAHIVDWKELDPMQSNAHMECEKKLKEVPFHTDGRGILLTEPGTGRRMQWNQDMDTFRHKSLPNKSVKSLQSKSLQNKPGRELSTLQPG